MGIKNIGNITPIIRSGAFSVYKCSSDSGKFILKTLIPELRNEKHYETLESEFQILSEIKHPNILCVTEFKEIPGLGKCIIMEDFYGETLDDILRNNQLTPRLLTNIQYNLIDTIAFLQECGIPHKLDFSNLLINSESGILKIIITDCTDKQTEESDIKFFGTVLELMLGKIPGKHNRLNKIADKCIKGNYHNTGELQLELEKYSSNTIYIPIIVLLIILLSILYWVNKL